MELMLIIIGGIMNGSFAIPTRYLQRLGTGSIWFFHSVIGLVVIAWGIFFMIIPTQLIHYLSLSPLALAWMLGGGIIFGLGQLCFARAIATIGIALSFSINLGLGMIIGSLFVAAIKGFLFTMHGALICTAVAFILVGLILYYFTIKGKSQTHLRYKKGWTLAIMAGFASGLQNIAFVIVSFHSQSDFSTHNAYWFWPPFLSVAAIVMMIGFKRQLTKQNQCLIIPKATEWPLIIVMGLLFTGSLAFYSLGMSHLSHLGKVIGWPLLMVMIILTSQGCGLRFKEFNFNKRMTKLRIIISLFLFIFAIGILATQN